MTGAAMPRVFALAFVALFVASACASTGQPGSSSATAGPPAVGGTVTIPIQADPTLNPWSPNAFVESIFVNRVLFDGLTKPGKDLAPAPDLETRGEPSAAGLTWTFHLRAGAHGRHGRPLPAGGSGRAQGGGAAPESHGLRIAENVEKRFCVSLDLRAQDEARCL